METTAPSARWLHDVLDALGEGGAEVRRISEGSEELATIEIGHHLILRVALTSGAAEGLARERAVLASIVDVVELPVPRYRAHGRYDGLAWAAYPKLLGTSGRRGVPPDDARPEMAAALGRFLREVHGVRPPPGLPRGERDEPWRGRPEELMELASVIEAERPELVTAETIPYLKAEIDAPPAARVRVLCHGDLKGEHVLLSNDRRRITGILDWNDAMVGDPAVDIAGVVIWLGPEFGRMVAGSTGSDDPHLADRGIFLARVGMLWGLGRSLLGREDWPIDLAVAQVRSAFDLR